MARIENWNQLKEYRKEFQDQQDPNRIPVSVCCGTGCIASLAGEVADAFEREIEGQGAAEKVLFRKTGCQGFCEKGPLVAIGDIFYVCVTVEDVPEIVSETVLGGKVIERLLYKDPNSGEPCKTV